MNMCFVPLVLGPECAHCALASVCSCGSTSGRVKKEHSHQRPRLGLHGWPVVLRLWRCTLAETEIHIDTFRKATLTVHAKKKKDRKPAEECVVL